MDPPFSKVRSLHQTQYGSYLLDEAFRGKGIEETNESQSLIANLSSVDEGVWRAAPSTGTRTVESVVLHVGSCKVIYDDYAFGGGRLTWDDPAVTPWPDGDAPRTEATDWLTNAHDRLMGHVRELEDDDLSRLRMANWGSSARRAGCCPRSSSTTPTLR
jgi:hypothetical protein